jgi:holo-[acyl-carrier protein] synthase
VKDFSIGVDIEEVRRFQTLIRNKRFLKRVFTVQEISYCSSKKNKAQHFAVRFAAKEAIWKAMSDLLLKSKRRLGHRDIGLRNDANGKPQVILPSSLKAWSRRVTVSLSHTKAYAVATAFVNK